MTTYTESCNRFQVIHITHIFYNTYSSNLNISTIIVSIQYIS